LPTEVLGVDVCLKLVSGRLSERRCFCLVPSPVRLNLKARACYLQTWLH